ncbi:MAG TPA: hypothetical protein VGO67_15150 [Verrucomicrobiae bacterium]|jgi:Zn-finger nucleic acid-binding protein
MDSQSEIEQFMHSYFQERTATIRRHMVLHQVFRSRFYHDECFWDCGRGSVNASEAEKVLDISSTDAGANIVTKASENRRHRYRLESFGESWLISAVDMECSLCSGKGADSKCAICNGVGWLDEKELSRYLEREYSIGQRPFAVSEQELGDRLNDNPSIEQFMADYFRAKIALVRQRGDMDAAYRRRFFSSQCAWGSNIKSIEWCEAEKIVNLKTADLGFFVFTDRNGPLRIRYQLVPKTQSWLIWKGAAECSMCIRRGIRADCFLCAGTGWANGTNSGPSKPPADPPRWQP